MTFVRFIATGALSGAILLAGNAAAQPTTKAQRDQAAAAYDEGATLFDRAQYAAAAVAFLRADDTLTSSDAVSSALVSARKTNDHLLIIKVAERAIARETLDPKLSAQGRQALIDAARHLAQVDLSCEPEPCSIALDQVEVKPGTHYLLPGTHAASASAPGFTPDDERLRLDASVTYRVVLHPVRPGSAMRPSEIATSQPPAAATPAANARADRAKTKPLPPAAFYTGAAVTAVLAALTVWSGIDTLAAKSDLPDPAPQSDIDDVKGKILRSNLLFGGTLITGALTTYAGFALVNWKGAASQKHGTLEAMPRGAMLNFAGTF
ncbi:MAG TPA: hypothetical protein VK524_28260 [Polyangiaceae bacterium]|nr:hypothetical protein [Polyangiaceae bacterium]